MATSNINYGGVTTIALSSTSLGSSSTFVAGRESTQVDNTANEFNDVLVQGFTTTGASPTADKYLKLSVWGSHTSLATVALDGLDGADSAETLTSVEIASSILTLARSVRVNSISNQTYHFKPFSIAQIFGEVPQFWGLFLAHDTGVSLNSSAGNHEFKYTGIKFDSV